MSKLQRMAIAEAKALIERAKDRLNRPEKESMTSEARDDLDKAIGWLTQVLGKDSES